MLTPSRPSADTLPRIRTILVALAFPILGCATGGGTFAADGFHHSQYPYVVRYSDPRAREVLDENWRVDNFVINYDGSIGAPKTADGYEGPEEIDFTGSGVPTKVTVPYFDLKLDNRKTSAVIWLQTIPLSKDHAERNLKNLVEDYANAISGSGFYAAVEDQGKVVREKTFAAKIVDGKETTLGSLEAYDAKIELANVDQLRLDPAARTAIIRVVLVRTNYMHTFLEDGPAVPTFVRVGYRASPGDFDAGLPDFERFLKLLQFGPPPK
jgi:hypothetical protein